MNQTKYCNLFLECLRRGKKKPVATVHVFEQSSAWKEMVWMVENGLRMRKREVCWKESCQNNFHTLTISSVARGGAMGLLHPQAFTAKH